MKDTIITLTPPIDGVQYGYNDEQIKEGDWMWNQWKGTFEGCFGIAGKTWHKSMKKVICCTNPKDLRFPFLVMPSKEQEVDVELLADNICAKETSNDRIYTAYQDGLKDGFIAGFNANPAKYTQEQMEKAYNHAMWACGDTGHGQSFNEYIQSIQPTVKAVRVEMEESYIEADAWGSPVIKYKMKVETSSEYSQGIVRAIEVILTNS